jgi:hypothetical protein
MRSRIRIVAAIVGLASLATPFLFSGPSAQASGVRGGNGALIPVHGSRNLLPTHKATVTSLNWSGYAVLPGLGHPVTAVTSSFVVPSVGVLPPGFSGIWTGIGGYNTQDLIQAGIAVASIPTDPIFGDQYYAWYEILPASSTQITGCKGDPNCTIAPGQTVTVSINSVGHNLWSIAMADLGHWTYNKTITYASTQTSAEWILEAPSLISPLPTTMAPVGQVHFGPSDTYTIPGSGPRSIAQGNPVRIILSLLGLLNEATPSNLSTNGQSFSGCAYTTSCPTPAH